jgi:hypothetical protein
MFGNTTVGFVTITTSGEPDEFGVRPETETIVEVAGCRHRPLSASEASEVGVEISTQVWKTTAPPSAAAIAAESTGRLTVDGDTFQIIGGAQPFTDMDSRPFKVTILSKKQEG